MIFEGMKSDGSRKILLAFFILSLLFPSGWSLSRAQIKIEGRVADAETGEPLPFAHVYVDSLHATVTDYDGYFRLRLPSDNPFFIVMYLGYHTDTVFLEKDRAFYEVRLQPEAEQLAAVEIGPGQIPPEIRLLREAIARKKANNYLHKLPAFTYTKYIKLTVTANPDEIEPLFDTIRIRSKGKDTVVIDSSLYELKREVRDKHLWLYEAVVRVAGGKGRHKSKITGIRTAGLKKPVYEFDALQAANQDLYADRYRLIFRPYTSPFSRAAEKEYEFEIEDTLLLHGRRVIALNFRHKTSPPVVGTLYFDMESLALARLQINTYEQIQMKADYRFMYDPAHEVWFPEGIDMKLKVIDPDNPFIPLPDFKKDTLIVRNVDTIRKTYTTYKTVLDFVYADYIMRVRDVRIGNEAPEKIRYAVETDPLAHMRDSLFWARYRIQTRSEKEEKTYRYIDSLAAKENIEYKLNRKKRLFYGYLPLGKWLEADLLKLTDYNRYEGFRLQLALQTGEYFSERFQLSAYGAYGFRDKDWKYGAGFRYLIHRPSFTRLFVTYEKDLTKAASFSFIPSDRGSRPPFAYMSSDRFLESRGYEGGLTGLIGSNLAFRLAAGAQEVTYTFPVSDSLSPEGRFRYVNASFYWTPFDEYAATAYGRLLLKPGYPRFFILAEKGLPAPGSALPAYYRLEFRFIVRKSYASGHHTDLLIRSGYASAGAPLFKLYSPRNNRPRTDSFAKSITLALQSVFETMYDLEFTDNFVTTFHLSHTFANIPWIGDSRMHIRLTGRAAYGFRHEGQPAIGRSLRAGYYEAGLEFHQLLQSMGLGVYYRFGPYAFDSPAENVALRLTFAPFKITAAFGGNRKKE